MLSAKIVGIISTKYTVRAFETVRYQDLIDIYKDQYSLLVS